MLSVIKGVVYSSRRGAARAPRRAGRHAQYIVRSQNGREAAQIG